MFSSAPRFTGPGDDNTASSLQPGPGSFLWPESGRGTSHRDIWGERRHTRPRNRGVRGVTRQTERRPAPVELRYEGGHLYPRREGAPSPDQYDPRGGAEFVRRRLDRGTRLQHRPFAKPRPGEAVPDAGRLTGLQRDVACMELSVPLFSSPRKGAESIRAYARPADSAPSLYSRSQRWDPLRDAERAGVSATLGPGAYFTVEDGGSMDALPLSRADYASKSVGEALIKGPARTATATAGGRREGLRRAQARPQSTRTSWTRMQPGSSYTDSSPLEQAMRAQLSDLRRGMSPAGTALPHLRLTTTSAATSRLRDAHQRGVARSPFKHPHVARRHSSEAMARHVPAPLRASRYEGGELSRKRIQEAGIVGPGARAPRDEWVPAPPRVASLARTTSFSTSRRSDFTAAACGTDEELGPGSYGAHESPPPSPQRRRGSVRSRSRRASHGSGGSGSPMASPGRAAAAEPGQQPPQHRDTTGGDRQVRCR